MSINLIQKSIIPLFLATLLLGVFFWQFTSVYAFLIEQFTEERLSVLYSHLFIYSFLILTLFVSFINLFNYFIIKSKVFVLITILALLIFYALSYAVYVDIFQYFLSFPLSDNVIMGAILFVVGSFSFALYSMAGLWLHRLIPLTHILIFTLLGLGYSAFFIDTNCYPIADIFTKF